MYTCIIYNNILNIYKDEAISKLKITKTIVFKTVNIDGIFTKNNKKISYNEI